MKLYRRGILFALSSPSGAGKTTVAAGLIKVQPCLSMSVSVTTRPPRPGEVDGVSYHFKSKNEFNTLRDQGAFLEWAEVFNHYYGTLETPVRDGVEQGKDVLFDIDWQGTQQLKHSMGEDLVSVFILPPSLKALENRLRARAQDDEEVIAYRMSKARDEMSHWAEYDYVVINEDLPLAIDKVMSILEGERNRRQRHVNLAKYVQELLQKT